MRFASLVLLLALSPAACGQNDVHATAGDHAPTPAGAPASDPAPSPTGAPDGSAPGAADGSDAYLDTPEVDTYLTAQMQAARAPGIAVALIKGGHIGWAKGYGLADIDAKRPVTADTLFMLASVSKTVTSVALMRLLEDPARHVSLDDDIDASLPFAVRNPAFPDAPITFRMLLTHTSSFDGVIGLEDLSNTVTGDPPVPLHDFLAASVAQKESWGASKPGTAYSYSNIGAALAGYLVEAISGKSLEDYCQSEIFAPLHMNETSWFLRGLDSSHIATPYEITSGPPQAQGLYGVEFYPATDLRTSVTQLARFLMMFAQHGQYGGARILKDATVDEMRRVQFPAIDPTQGLIWLTEDFEPTLIGHSGGYYGVTTQMWFDPKTGSGYVLLSNSGELNAGYSDTAINDAWGNLNTKLAALAEALP
jgi:CubicO group peptidase (beta-lactamase class C family)